jgi:RimJ/RimL family protein N-acetyltransferase
MGALGQRVRDASVRAREGLDRHGVKNFAREVAVKAAERVRLREEHVWYELRIGEFPPLPALEAPLRMVVASDEQLELVAQFGHSVAAARRRFADGHEQMLMFEGDRLVFGCCVFRGVAPAVAAPGNQLVLPPDTVCIEDSYTTREDRRRGLGVQAGMAMIERLRAQGVQSMITKVAADNVKAQKASLKAGFQEIARVRLERTGTRKRVDVEVLNDSSMGAEIARRLGGHAPPTA